MLSAQAKAQLSFHAFLEALLRSRGTAPERARLQALRVPAYLLADKRSALLEADIAAGWEPSSAYKHRADEFLSLHPELGWRIKRARAGGGDLSIYKPEPAP